MSKRHTGNGGKIHCYLIDTSSFIKVQSLLTISCIVFVNRMKIDVWDTDNYWKRVKVMFMFYEKIYKSVLIDRLTEQTRKFIKVLLRGERYPGEYKNCKNTLERIQKQLLWEEKRSDFNISVSAPGKLSININKI